MEVVRKWLVELLDNNPAESLQISLSSLTEKLCIHSSGKTKKNVQKIKTDLIFKPSRFKCKPCIHSANAALKEQSLGCSLLMSFIVLIKKTSAFHFLR